MFRHLRSQAPLTRSRRISGAVEALNAANSPRNSRPLQQQTPQDVPFHRLRAARDKFALSCGGLCAMRPLEWTLLLVLLVRPCGEGTPWWCRLRVGRRRSGANHPQQSPIFCHPLEVVRRPSPSTSRSLRLDHLILGRLVRQPVPEPTLVCQGR